MKKGPRCCFGSFIVLLLVASAGAQDSADPYRVQAFTSPSTRVMALGEQVFFQVEGVAAPVDEASAERLIRALQRIAFPSSIDTDFRVLDASTTTIRRRAGSQIIEFERRFTLAPVKVGPLTIPAAVIRVDDGVQFEAPPQTVLAYRPSTALDEARRNVVSVVAEGRFERRSLSRIGSGFLIADDALVTAYHVVVGANTVRIRLANGETMTTNKVWAVDPVRDVVVLRVDPEESRRYGLAPLRLARDLYEPHNSAKDGAAFTAGWPDGAQRFTAGERFQSLRFPSGDLLGVSSNAVRPGDSGGPLLNEVGEVLGVVSSGRGTEREPDALQEDLCLAADPRRVLAVRIATEEPRSLREALHEAQLEAPSAEVIEAASVVMIGGVSHSEKAGVRERISRAMERAPEDASLQFLAGSVFQAIGDIDHAEAAYAAALQSLSDYFPALYALGDLHYRRGEYVAAEELFARTRSYPPYSRLGALGAARILTVQHRYDAAAVALGEVLVRNHSYAPALYLLAFGQLAHGRVEEAAALAVRLDGIDPGWAAALRLQILAPLIRPSSLQALPRAEILTNTGIAH